MQEALNKLEKQIYNLLKEKQELQTEVEAVKESLNTQRELAIVSGMRIDNLQQENEALRAEKTKWSNYRGHK